MEKKVRYLMLLLCLFMFPIRVFAEETPTETLDTNESSTVVAKINNESNPENLETIEDSQNILQQDETTQAVNDEENLTADQTLGEETTSDDYVLVGTVDEITGSTETYTTPEDETDETSGEETGEDLGLPEEEELGEEEGYGDYNGEAVKTLKITGVSAELWSGKEFQFTGQSAEPEKYTIVREQWESYGSSKDGYAFKSISSDEIYNAGIPEENRISVIEPDHTYHYSVVVEFKEGYYFEYTYNEEYDYQFADIVVNGIQVRGYSSQDLDENQMLFSTGLSTDSHTNNIEYVDLNLSNVSNDAYIGQAPTYNSQVDNSHFAISEEAWYWIERIENEKGDYDYYYHINTNGDYELGSGEILFETFESGQVYNHEIVIEADEGFEIEFDPGSDSAKYHIYVNGTEVEGYIFKTTNPSSDKTAYIVIYYEIEPKEAPAQEITQEAVATTTTYTYETSSEPVVTQLETTEKKDDTKLEVKKDDKEDTKEKEVKEDSNSTGLIVFLIILVIIAIAIPVTIYRKKQ